MNTYGLFGMKLGGKKSLADEDGFLKLFISIVERYNLQQHIEECLQLITLLRILIIYFLWLRKWRMTIAIVSTIILKFHG